MGCAESQSAGHYSKQGGRGFVSASGNRNRLTIAEREALERRRLHRNQLEALEKQRNNQQEEKQADIDDTSGKIAARHNDRTQSSSDKMKGSQHSMMKGVSFSNQKKSKDAVKDNKPLEQSTSSFGFCSDSQVGMISFGGGDFNSGSVHKTPAGEGPLDGSPGTGGFTGHGGPTDGGGILGFVSEAGSSTNSNGDLVAKNLGGGSESAEDVEAPIEIAASPKLQVQQFQQPARPEPLLRNGSMSVTSSLGQPVRSSLKKTRSPNNKSIAPTSPAPSKNRPRDHMGLGGFGSNSNSKASLGGGSLAGGPTAHWLQQGDSSDEDVRGMYGEEDDDDDWRQPSPPGPGHLIRPKSHSPQPSRGESPESGGDGENPLQGNGGGGFTVTPTSAVMGKKFQ